MINHSKRFAIGVATIYLLLPTLGLAVCPNLEGLYEKRKELRKGYERAFGENREMRDMYMKQIQAIDRKYRTVIYEIFFEHEKKEYNSFGKCCDSPIKDGYLFFVCKLIKYYRDGTAEILLKDMPLGKEGYDDLWEIDDIIFSNNYSRKTRPKLFDKGSFVLLFLGSFNRLAADGNPKAIDNFLNMKLFADGWIAEYIADSILSLFENQPEIVIKNWNVIKKYKLSLRYQEFQFKANALIKEYRDLCQKRNFDTSLCKEIIDFLEQRDKGQ